MLRHALREFTTRTAGGGSGGLVLDELVGGRGRRGRLAVVDHELQLPRLGEVRGAAVLVDVVERATAASKTLRSSALSFGAGGTSGPWSMFSMLRARPKRRRSAGPDALASVIGADRSGGSSRGQRADARVPKVGEPGYEGPSRQKGTQKWDSRTCSNSGTEVVAFLCPPGRVPRPAPRRSGRRAQPSGIEAYGGGHCRRRRAVAPARSAA